MAMFLGKKKSLSSSSYRGRVHGGTILFLLEGESTKWLSSSSLRESPRSGYPLPP